MERMSLFMIDGVLDNTTTPHSADADFQAGSTIGQLIVTGTKKKSMTEIALERGGLEPDKNLTMPICTTWPMEWISRIDLIAGGNMFLWGVFDGAIVSITTKTEMNWIKHWRLRQLLTWYSFTVRLSNPCGVLCSGIRDGEGPPFDGSRLPHDALLEPDCQARRYGTGHRRVLHLRRTGRLRHLYRGRHADGGKIVQRRQRLLPE